MTTASLLDPYASLSLAEAIARTERQLRQLVPESWTPIPTNECGLCEPGSCHDDACPYAIPTGRE